MPFYESFDEFKTRMDCDCEFLQDRWLFRNGATSDGHGYHIEPPTHNPPQLKKLKREFLNFRLKKATDAFNDMQNYVAEQSHAHVLCQSAMSPRKDSVDILKRLQGRVLRLRESIKALDTDETTDSPEQIHQRVREQLEQEKRQHMSHLVSEASQISI